MLPPTPAFMRKHLHHGAGVSPIVEEEGTSSASASSTSGDHPTSSGDTALQLAEAAVAAMGNNGGKIKRNLNGGKRSVNKISFADDANSDDVKLLRKLERKLKKQQEKKAMQVHLQSELLAADESSSTQLSGEDDSNPMKKRKLASSDLNSSVDGSGMMSDGSSPNALMKKPLSLHVDEVPLEIDPTHVRMLDPLSSSASSSSASSSSSSSAISPAGFHSGMSPDGNLASSASQISPFGHQHTGSGISPLTQNDSGIFKSTTSPDGASSHLNLVTPSSNSSSLFTPSNSLLLGGVHHSLNLMTPSASISPSTSVSGLMTSELSPPSSSSAMLSSSSSSASLKSIHPALAMPTTTHYQLSQHQQMSSSSFSSSSSATLSQHPLLSMQTPVASSAVSSSSASSLFALPQSTTASTSGVLGPFSLQTPSASNMSQPSMPSSTTSASSSSSTASASGGVRKSTRTIRKRVMMDMDQNGQDVNVGGPGATAFVSGDNLMSSTSKTPTSTTSNSSSLGTFSVPLSTRARRPSASSATGLTTQQHIMLLKQQLHALGQDVNNLSSDDEDEDEDDGVGNLAEMHHEIDADAMAKAMLNSSSSPLGLLASTTSPSSGQLDSLTPRKSALTSSTASLMSRSKSSASASMSALSSSTSSALDTSPSSAAAAMAASLLAPSPSNSPPNMPNPSGSSLPGSSKSGMSLSPHAELIHSSSTSALSSSSSLVDLSPTHSSMTESSAAAPGVDTLSSIFAPEAHSLPILSTGTTHLTGIKQKAGQMGRFVVPQLFNFEGLDESQAPSTSASSSAAIVSSSGTSPSPADTLAMASGGAVCPFACNFRATTLT
jgi:hypothetical protein